MLPLNVGGHGCFPHIVVTCVVTSYGHRDVFSAGTSHYGVADCELLAKETHKFESRYLDGLIAPYNESTVALFQERSPMSGIANASRPIMFFQGKEDKVGMDGWEWMGTYKVKRKKKKDRKRRRIFLGTRS